MPSSTVVSLTKHESWTKAGPVVSHLDDAEISALEERAVASTAEPSTLGLWAFATGTWIVGTVIAGFFPDTALTGTIPILLVFAGLTQFIAGLFAFRRANMLAATAFCSFGAFNVATAFFFALQAANTLGTSGPPMILQGFVLESFGFIAFALTIAALRTNAALVLVLGTLCVGYVLTGIHNFNAGLVTIRDIGGWFLIVSAALAYYTGAAIVVNSAWKQTILPIGGEA
ncbi:MAG TPA: acetate uptake transporter [Pseudolabrys sp.]|nr:acetate uptake transporter [Pseudolabrys sp.]